MPSRQFLAAKDLLDDRDEILATGTPSSGTFRRRFAGRRCKGRIGSLTKPATPFGKYTRRGETGAGKMTLG